MRRLASSGAFLACWAFVLPAAAQQRSSFRIAKVIDAGRGRLTLDLAYNNPGASARAAEANTADFYLHPRIAPYSANGYNPCGGSKEVLEGIHLGPLPLPGESGLCKLTIDVCKAGLAQAKPNDTMYLAAVFGFGANRPAASGHRWGVAGSPGNATVPFCIPQSVLDAARATQPVNGRGPGTAAR